MNAFSAESFVAALAIIGIVIVVSALLSGLIERSGLPQVAVFLAIGAALGPVGLGVLNLTLDSSALRVVATLSLALVLFTDAVSLNISEVRRHATLALRVLGPGTLLSAALTALIGWWLLGLPLAGAAILGAALASTDPVLLRGLLQRRDIPGSARQALQLESGLNDAVLLPVIIVAMAFLGQGASNGAAEWARLAIDLFLLGPGAGVAVGLLSVAALDLIRRRIGVRRDYESLYSLGVAFTAFAAAEAVHGSGFLAAFTAGLTIAALDVELCDCFVEYGGVTAEMLLLFTFVLFGSSLIWSGFTVISGATLLFAAVVILLRPPVYLASLARSGVDRRGRLLIAWFGPRGLSSLLLILLPVFAGIPGSERLFALCSLVVLLSVVLHGGSPMLLARAAQRRAREQSVGPSEEDVARTFGSPPGSPEPIIQTESDDGGQAQATLQCTATCSPDDSVGTKEPAEGVALSSDESVEIGAQSISIRELKSLWGRAEPVVILDVRTERSLETSDLQARGAVRMPPDHTAARAAELGLQRQAWLVAYCA
ncbi:MAG TPA: cation:proton antiporter [Pyrinomonadaceae bacterium]|nr:cation:proton antiporter [Pyrinomonadaceae bacterium]